MSAQHAFQAEVGRLLDIVANALYSEKEIFLRELVSNAADACDRLRYAALSNPALLAGDAELKIELSVDTAARTLTVRDNGIGMTEEELAKNLGTIAHSGTREAMAGTPDMKNLIGAFGVGFYASFMVAGRVDVLSRKAGEENNNRGGAWLWSSDGRSGYALTEALKPSRGTEITLHLNEASGEYLLEERLRQIVQKYSDHIGFPILINGVAANKASALWMRPKNEIAKEQYLEFYRHVSGAHGLDEPWLTLHWRAEGAIEYTNLLFVPGMKPFDLYDPRRQHGVKLYVKRVFITDGLDGLIPPFLRFLKGVVDSEDLPLNISREMLQASPMVGKMNAAITRKVLDALAEKAEQHPGEFFEFWSLFGPVVKEGLYDAHNHREALLRVARFHSTNGPALTSLADYVSRMKPEQEHIYYLSAASPEAAQNSPQLEAFRAQGIEVLFMTDAIDEFWLPIQRDYKGKTFKSVTRGDAALKKEEAPADLPLLEKLRAVLKDEVKDVVVSARLVDSPVCLVAPEGDVDIQMQRLLKRSQNYDGRHQHILEVNAGHPIIRKMAKLSDDQLKETALLLLDQARILEGEPLKDPAGFVRRMSAAIEKGLV